MSEVVDCIRYIVSKICWSFYILCKFLLYRLLDLIGLIFNILACCTIIRLPCMVRQFTELSNLTEWRSIGLIHCLIFLMDLPIIAMGIACIVLSLGALLIPFTKEVLKSGDIYCEYTHKTSFGIYFGGIQLRILVAEYFIRLMVDILCLPCFLLTVITWRGPHMISQMFSVNDVTYLNWNYRSICLKEFFQFILDVPCLFLTVLLLFTWRNYFLIKSIKKEKARADTGLWYKLNRFNKWRFFCFKEFAQLIVDILCAFLSLIVLLSWRMPILIRKLRSTSTKSWNGARKVIFINFLLLFLDIPCIISGVFVIVTFVRLPFFIKDIIAIQKYRKIIKSNSENTLYTYLFEYDLGQKLELSKHIENMLRISVIYQFGMVFVDVFFIILSIIIGVSMWRLYPLIKDVKKYHQKPFWIIRKKILLHSGFLLIDIPAIAMCLIVLISVIRFPRLLKKLTHSGNFYMEFAVIVGIEFIGIFIDLIFILMAILLSFLRPIDVWIHLLEDENHKKYRLLKFHRQWETDIFQKKKEYYDQLTETYICSLKVFVPQDKIQTEMSQNYQIYADKLSKLLNKCQNNELSPRFCYLLKHVMWCEKQRPYMLAQKYKIESDYLLHVNVTIVNSQLHVWKEKMSEYEKRVSDSYEDIINYKETKPPIWSGTCGLFTRSRSETRKVLIKCLTSGFIWTLVLIIVNILFLYRGLWLIARLRKQWYNRVQIVRDCLFQYFLDFIALIVFILVTLLIWRAPFLYADICNHLCIEKQWKKARSNIFSYIPILLNDVHDAIDFLFSGKCLRYTAAAILFSLLSPADVLLTFFKVALHKPTNQSSQPKGNAYSYLLTAFVYSCLVSLPFLLFFGALPNIYLDWIPYILTPFCILFVILLIPVAFKILTYSVSAPSLNAENLKLPYIDYIRIDWSNILVFVHQMIEACQLVGLVFLIPSNFLGYYSLHKFSDIVLFRYMPFCIKEIFLLAGFISWSLLSGAPAIFENILETYPEGTLVMHSGWRLIIFFLSNTLFVSFIESFVTPFSCYKSIESCGNNISTNCTIYRLEEEHSVICWEGSHLWLASVSLLGFQYFILTSLLYGSIYGKTIHKKQGLSFAPGYEMVMNLIKSAMIISVIMLHQLLTLLTCCILIVLSLLAIALTLIYKPLLKHEACNSNVLLAWRIGCYIMTSGAAFAIMFVELFDKEKNSSIPLVIILSTVFLSLVALMIGSIKFQKNSKVEKVRASTIKRILNLEAMLFSEQKMSPKWNSYRKLWRRSMRNVRVAQEQDRMIPENKWKLFGEWSPSPNQETQGFIATSELNNPPPVYEDATKDFHYEQTNEKQIPKLEWNTELPSNSDENRNLTINAINDTPANNHTNTEILTSLYPRVSSLKCEGTSLLLFFENCISYANFRFSFISQITLWRNSVNESDWIGLNYCFDILENSLDGTFYQPRRLDRETAVTHATEIDGTSINININFSEPAPIWDSDLYDPIKIRERSIIEFETGLNQLVGLHELNNEKWAKLIHTIFHGVAEAGFIHSWQVDNIKNSFTVVFTKKSLKGTVTSVGPLGYKAAVGATIRVERILLGKLENNILTFDRVQPSAGKGPITVTIDSISIISKDQDSIYVAAKGKKVRYDKALDSIKSIKWVQI